MASGAKPVIGLIGGIGSGKSGVAAEFARLGGAVISGDRLGHAALLEADIRAAVVARFGTEIVGKDGEIERKRLGAIVFANQEALRSLEKIVQPRIEAGIAQGIALAQENAISRFVVLDAAVLLEAGWNKFCSAIVYIDTPREVRLRRLAQQRGWTEREVLAREQAQWPLEDKMARADAIIDNSGPLDLAAAQAARFLQQRFFEVAP